MFRQWQCASCSAKFNWALNQPAIIANACVFYGQYGRPPFNKEGFNNGPIIAKFVYCEKCSR